MRVAIYTRVSGRSNRQDAANQSLQLIEYCQRQGWDYVEYTDRMTGTRADRTAFLQMFEDARLKHFDIVLFWALDRSLVARAPCRLSNTCNAWTAAVSHG